MKRIIPVLLHHMSLVVFAATVLPLSEGQDAAADKFPPVVESEIVRIDAPRITTALTIDGKLNEEVWAAAQESPRFVDLISGKPTAHATHVKVLWDQQNLYVGFKIEEPNVQAKFERRDSPIYQENDVELFIAGKDAYYEFEVNALGTIYEGLFVWESNYRESGLAGVPELDKSNPDVGWQAFNGVGFKNHPRGPRLAFLAWDFPQAQIGVHVDGTLNDNSDIDRGWSAELAFPWHGMRVLNMSRPVKLPPDVGDTWRMDFSRFNQYKIDRGGHSDSGGWALSHHGVWDSHIPECFPFVTFRGPNAQAP